jgi:beta-glucosidase
MSFPETEKDQPPRHLRGFQKVGLKPGEAKVVEFPLVRRDES